MRSTVSVAALMAVAGLATAQPATIVISEWYSETNQFDNSGLDNLGTTPDGVEIDGFFDTSQEVIQEFMEIYNYGDEPVDITGWRFEFEDNAMISGPFMNRVNPGQPLIIPPKTAFIVYGTSGGGTGGEFVGTGTVGGGASDSDVDPGIESGFGSVNRTSDIASPELIEAAWGIPPEQHVFLQPFDSLANGPNAVDEIFTLIDADDNVVDVLNFDDDLPWPILTPDGFGSALMAEFVSQENIDALFPSGQTTTPQEANDNPLAWVRTTQGVRAVSDAGTLVAINSPAVIPFGNLKSEGGRFANGVFVDVAALENDPTNTDAPFGEVVVVDGFDETTGRQIAGTVYVFPGEPFTNQSVFFGNFGSPGVVDATPDDNDFNGGVDADGLPIGNGIDDDVEIFLGLDFDEDRNTIPDSVELLFGDFNNNGILDNFEIIQDEAAFDCNFNNLFDLAEIDANPSLDSDGNGRIDQCDVPNVLITEISFDPAGNEGGAEFIEVTNLSGSSVDLSGWGFIKLDLTPLSLNLGEFFAESFTVIPDGTTLAAGESLILTAAFAEDLPEFAGEDVAQYQAAWGEGFQIVPQEGWGFLANNASPDNEVVALYAPPAAGVGTTDAFGDPIDFVLVDVVDYDAEFTEFEDLPFTPENEALIGTWPGDTNGYSLVLRPEAADNVANNFGGNWEFAVAGTFGSRFGIGGGEVWSSFNEQAGPGEFGDDSADGTGEVLITEIMAVPNTAPQGTGLFETDDDTGEELEIVLAPQTEWIEIVNTTNAPIDVADWFLADEDGQTTGFSSPQGTVLLPGEAAVVLGLDGEVNGEQFSFYGCAEEAIFEFQQAWGGGYKVLTVEAWAADLDPRGEDTDDLGGLSNGPGISNEILTLRKADGTLVDLVNFDDELNDRTGDWPIDPTGDVLDVSFSIIFDSNAATADAVDNNNGSAWFFSDMGFQSETRASNLTALFTGTENGSPIPGAIPMQGSPGLAFGADPSSIDLSDVFQFTECPTEPCNAADLATTNGEFGNLDGADTSAFIQAFLSAAPAADVDGDGAVNGSDIGTFVQAFIAGCPDA